MSYTQNFETQFRPLQMIEDYNPQYIDPEYGNDRYWDNERYDKESLQFRHDDYPPTDDDDDPEIQGQKIIQGPHRTLASTSDKKNTKPQTAS